MKIREIPIIFLCFLFAKSIQANEADTNEVAISDGGGDPPLCPACPACETLDKIPDETSLRYIDYVYKDEVVKTIKQDSINNSAVKSAIVDVVFGAIQEHTNSDLTARNYEKLCEHVNKKLGDKYAFGWICFMIKGISHAKHSKNSLMFGLENQETLYVIAAGLKNYKQYQELSEVKDTITFDKLENPAITTYITELVLKSLQNNTNPEHTYRNYTKICMDIFTQLNAKYDFGWTCIMDKYHFINYYGHLLKFDLDNDESLHIHAAKLKNYKTYEKPEEIEKLIIYNNINNSVLVSQIVKSTFGALKKHTNSENVYRNFTAICMDIKDYLDDKYQFGWNCFIDDGGSFLYSSGNTVALQFDNGDRIRINAAKMKNYKHYSYVNELNEIIHNSFNNPTLTSSILQKLKDALNKHTNFEKTYRNFSGICNEIHDALDNEYAAFSWYCVMGDRQRHLVYTGKSIVVNLDNFESISIASSDYIKYKDYEVYELRSAITKNEFNNDKVTSAAIHSLHKALRRHTNATTLRNKFEICKDVAKDIDNAYPLLQITCSMGKSSLYYYGYYLGLSLDNGDSFRLVSANKVYYPMYSKWELRSKIKENLINNDMTDNVLSWLQYALSTKITHDNTVRDRHGICTYIHDRLKSYYSSNGNWNCLMGEFGGSYTYGSYYIQFDIDGEKLLIYNNNN